MFLKPFLKDAHVFGFSRLTAVSSVWSETLWSPSAHCRVADNVKTISIILWYYLSFSFSFPHECTMKFCGGYMTYVDIVTLMYSYILKISQF